MADEMSDEPTFADHEKQHIQHNISHKWMSLDETSGGTFHPGNRRGNMLTSSAELTVSPVIPLAKFEEALSLFQIVNDRRQAVSSWIGSKIAFASSDKSHMPVTLLVPKYVSWESSVRFPTEGISVISSLEHYLCPLFRWHNFGIPSVIRRFLAHQPTRLQAFTLPYILDGRHAIVHIIDRSQSATDEFELLMGVVSAFTIYEENIWTEFDSESTVILNVTGKPEKPAPIVETLIRRTQKAGFRQHAAFETLHVTRDDSFEFCMPRNLRYVFVTDVPFISQRDIDTIVKNMPLHCILVILCATHAGKGLLSGAYTSSLECVTIQSE